MTLARGLLIPPKSEGEARFHDKRAAIFLDRDGVIIENRESYVTHWGDVSFIPHAFDALRRMAASSLAIVLVTNQSAVARGLITIDEAVDLNRQVIEAVQREGGRIDAWYLCPHGPRDGCECRKPAPGMLLQAGAQLHLDLPSCWMVGDAVTDVMAAEAASVRPILVRTGRGDSQLRQFPQELPATAPIAPDLLAAADLIFQTRKARTS